MSWQPPQYDPSQHQRHREGQPLQRIQTPQQQYPPQPAYPPGNYPPPPSAYPYPQQPYGQPPARKRKRVFMWVFIAVQALFVIWLITGIASAHGSNSSYAATQAAKFCGNGGWSPLYNSQAQCLTQYGATLKDAGTAGTAIGAGLVVVFWVIVDFLMAVTWLVVRLSRRRA